MNKRFLRLNLIFCLVLIVGMVQAQVVHEVINDQEVLVDLTVQPSIAYQVYAFEVALAVEHRYLGSAFDLNMAIYDTADNVLYDGLIEDFAQSGVELAGDEYLVLFYVTGEGSGRALVRFNTVEASPDVDSVTLGYFEPSDIYDWIVTGDVIEPVFEEDKLCAQAGSEADSSWFFHAPEAFVQLVQSSYGDTLGFGLEQALPNEETVVWLIVGNGLALEYRLGNAERDISYHVVPLRSGAGWFDPDGTFSDDELDADMFEQMLSDVTQVLIQGAGDTCLLTPEIYKTTATTQTIPYYAMSYTDVDGLPSGCEAYLVELESNFDYTGDLEQDIRYSLQALFSPMSDQYSNADVVNYLGEQGLTVESVAVEDGFATVEIGGTLMQIGTCVDGTLATQILLSVFNNPAIEGAMIISNGANMKPQFDMSGMTPADAEYTPADFSLRLYQ